MTNNKPHEDEPSEVTPSNNTPVEQFIRAIQNPDMDDMWDEV